MAPTNRDNPGLQERIQRLRMTFVRTHYRTTPRQPNEPSLDYVFHVLNGKLHPLFPQPSGPPHPKFPKTILHWLLMTEDELDSFAAYYGQISPNEFTEAYPAPMRWHREWLAKPETEPPALMPWDDEWLAQHGWNKEWRIRKVDFYNDDNSNNEEPTPKATAAGIASTSSSANSQTHIDSPHPLRQRRQRSTPSASPTTQRSPNLSPYLSAAERIKVKRRKVGKFMGLRGCETPTSEIERYFDWYEVQLVENVRRAAENDRDGSGGGMGRPNFGKGLL
jgi:hypothetical protein